MSLNIKPGPGGSGPEGSGHDAAGRSPLVPVALGTALVLVTYVTPIVSLTASSADLGAGSGSRAWILSSMSVGLAAALLVSGVLGDTFGRLRVYVAGLFTMALGAVACAVAQEPLLLVAGRVVEGVGGAAVLACGLALLAGHFPPGPPRMHATAVWGASVGLGIAVGSLVPAALGDVGSGWRESYVVAAVAALVLVVPTRRLADSRAEHPRRIDVPGLVLLVAGLTFLVAALTQVRDGVDAATVVFAVVAVAALVGFGVTEGRVAAPLVEPALLRSPGFVAATVGSLTLGAGMIGMASFVPTLTLVGLGRGVWTASLLNLTWALVSVASSLLMRRLPWQIRGAGGVSLMLLLVAFGQLLAIGLGEESGPWRIAVSMAVAGLGTGVLNAVLGREAVASVPPDRSAMGSGANNTARYLGAAIGITLFVIIATHAGDSVVEGWNVAVAVSAGLTVLGAVVIALVGRSATRRVAQSARPDSV